MCGFAGTLFLNADHAQSANKNTFIKQAARVANRGNDDARQLFLETIWLQHYRLAFQDVAGSTQPWLSPCRNFVLVFNGEIYNHHLLRSDIKKANTDYTFTTHGDTETIMAGFLTFGVAFFKMLEGEFAFVILKADGTEVWAARDHFGVKPLFFELSGVDTKPYTIAQHVYSPVKASRMHFSSEIKGLACEKRWDHDGALRQFVGLFEPIRTPFRSIVQIPPGGMLHAVKKQVGFFVTLSTNPTAIRQQHTECRPSSRDLLSTDNTTPGAGRQPSTVILRYPTTSTEHQNQLAEAMHQSVKNRLLSDVELGVYLSGGIDSKVVAFELSKLQSKSLSPKPKSFTIGFSHTEYDETDEALRFASHLGFDPHVVRINDKALTYSYPLAVQASENLQPYTNGAAKWWLSLFTRQFVRGVLTGDGADELWGGYPSFKYTAWWEFALRHRSGKTVFDKINAAPMGSLWRDTIYRKRFANFDKNPWQAGSSAAGTGADFVKSLALWGVAHPLFEQIETIATVVLGNRAQTWLADQAESIRSWFALGLCDTRDEGFLTNPGHATLLWQNYFCKTHLPVQVLNWVGDRMEMANTLEGRTPFLSREMRDLVSHLPHRAIIAGFLDKALLRKTYSKRFPPEFAATPKKQFGAPFLDTETLHRRFKTERIHELLPWLQVNNRFMNDLEQQIKNQSDAFFKTHLQSTKQTLLCSAIVEQTLIQNVEFERDKSFELEVLRT